jgi:hypothetical protein
MVAAICDKSGQLAGVHRTWLEQHHGIWCKAKIVAPKKVLGRMSGGAIPLWRGVPGVRLVSAPEGSGLVLAEGIETALSIAIACPERRVMAAISVGNMAALCLPATISDIVIAAENDGYNPQAAAALQRAIDRFASEGRSVRVARSPVGNDMNDALCAPVML